MWLKKFCKKKVAIPVADPMVMPIAMAAENRSTGYLYFMSMIAIYSDEA